MEKAGELVSDGEPAATAKRARLPRPLSIRRPKEAGARVLGVATDLSTRACGVGERVARTRLARGLSYYTGTIMEINVPDLAGSLGGGGRYDNLVGMFSGQDVPACGFSLGLERIIVVMTERGMFPEELAGTNADVLVTVWDDESVESSLTLARELRGQGLRVELYPEADKLGKQLKYASARGVPFVVVAGPDERARGEVLAEGHADGRAASVVARTVGA